MKTGRVVAAGAAGAYVAFRLALGVKRRISFRGKTVVITGGSRGLGLVIARQLAAEGAKLILIARHEQELIRARDMLEGDVRMIAVDVGDRLSLVKALGTEQVDVLINSAGTIQVGPAEHMTREDYERAMKVNFWGALNAIEAVLPGMRSRGFGRVVNISSIGGELAVPHMTPYTASKFALVGLSRALRAELAGTGVLVTTVCPTLMRTGSPYNAEFKGRAEEEYTWFSIADSLPVVSLAADRAASRIIRAARYGLASTFLSPMGRIASIMARIAPELAAEVLSLVARVMPKPETGAAAEIARRSRRGFELDNPYEGKLILRLTEQAAEENNEL